MNKLFYGNNLEVLRRYIKDETVDLCYIDPPFNSKRNYNQIYNNLGEDKAQNQAFIDTWTYDDHANQGLLEIQENYLGHFTSQSIDLINGLIPVLKKGPLMAYLIAMTLRIAEIYRVLKPTGSFYLHCDPTASHYLKLILDAIFCPQGGDYKNEIIWQRSRDTGSSKVISRKFPNNSDTILFYSKSDQFTFYPLYKEYEEKYLDRFKYEDEHGRYRWQCLKTYSNDRYKELEKQGKIRWGKNAKYPDYKQYIWELKGVLQHNVWTDINQINPAAKERLGYPTQKPEALLERIIKASSNENDVVLDAFCGCGTTVSVAQRLKRKWIGIDINYQSISLILKRLEDSFGSEILSTIELNGIPKDLAAAEALALKKDDRTRKEFEKWAVLTYTNNRAIINDKKGKDQGIDGIAYFQGEKDREKIILQVKSGKVSSKDIRDLQGVLTLENAALGIFLTLKKPTKDMISTAKSAGIYTQKIFRQPLDKIQIITIQEIIEQQKRLDIKFSFEVLKSAEKQQQIKADQMQLEL